MAALVWRLALATLMALLLALAFTEAAPRRGPRHNHPNPHQHHRLHRMPRRGSARPQRQAPAAPAVPAVPAVPADPQARTTPAISASLLAELRSKRNPQQTMSVKQAQEIGMCKFRVQQDVDPDRIPAVLWTVTCRETGCKCGTEGDFRCTQLTTEVKVSYKNGAENVLYPHSGCICAANDANDAASAAPKVIQ